NNPTSQLIASLFPPRIASFPTIATTVVSSQDTTQPQPTHQPHSPASNNQCSHSLSSPITPLIQQSTQSAIVTSATSSGTSARTNMSDDNDSRNRNAYLPPNIVSASASDSTPTTVAVTADAHQSV